MSLEGMDLVLKHLEKIEKDSTGPPMIRGMRQATMLVTGDAKRLAPVDRGRLRASLTQRIEAFGNSIRGIVGTKVFYGPFMELGTKHTRMPPPSALEGWAQRHGLPAGGGFLIARAIWRKGGLEGRRFLERAFQMNEGRITRLIGKTYGNIVRR